MGASAAIAGRIPNAFAQQTGALKLPILYPLSGPVATVGEPCKKGAEIAIKLLNAGGGIMGRTIEPTFIDDKGSPTAATALVREAISGGNNIVLGFVLSSQIAATVPIMNETKSILLTSSGSGVAFTHELFSRYVFPALDNDIQRANALAHLSAQKFPDVTTFMSVISDSKAYIDSYPNFQKFCKEAYAATGKKPPEFLAPLIAKLGTTDFRTQIGQVGNTNADAFYNFVVGADGVTFWKQAQAFNLGNKFKAVVDQTLDILVLKALKNNMPPNLWTLVGWWHGLHQDNPLSEAIYKEYVAETNDRYPSGFVHYGVVILQALAAAMKATGGKTDTESLIGALESIKFMAPKGEMYFRKEDHMLIGTEDFIKVVPSDDEPGIKVVDAFKLSTAELSPPPMPGKPYGQ